jgi:hypothetical protein
MALPKKVKKDINIAPQPIQPQYPFGYGGVTTPIRRKELADYITEDGTFLPKSILHEDMDGGMLDFVNNELGISIGGKKINIIDRILTIQRWGEFAQTWTFANEDRNVELPFIVVVRKPDVQYGSNPSLIYTIPDRKQFHFAKVPTWDGVRKGMDVYTIPQPVPVDITYDVKIISNRMRELNTFNRKVMQKFTSRQAYTFVKGHYIPIVMTTLSDESVIDTEDRRYYQQNYTFQLQGFLIDEEEFEVKPAITRSLMLFDTATLSHRSGSGSNSVIDGVPINSPNANHYRRKLTFATGCASPCSTSVCYPYNATVSLNRMDNVSSISVTVEPNEQATVTATLVGGSVTAVVITDGGQGYDSNPSVVFSDAPSSGVTATATATVTNGTVSTIDIINSGSGYLSTPTINVTNGFDYTFPLNVNKGGCYTVSIIPIDSTLDSYVVVEDTIHP